MFRFFCLCALIFSIPLALDGADLTERRPTAQVWLVIDEATGAQLRFFQTRQFRPIASTTKLLSALAVVRDGNLDSWVSISSRAAAQVPSKIGLKSKERWRRRDLLKALLMQSANDAASALAEDVQGTEKLFCKELTKLAGRLGCQNTSILRASGLPAKKQGSTAQDLALIVSASLSEAEILAILKTKEARIRSKSGRVIKLTNKNRLRTSSKGPVLGKTGYTRRALRCFAGRMTLQGRHHTIVLLGSKDLWADLRLLQSWTLNFVQALQKNRKALKKDQILSWQKKLLNEGFSPGVLDGIWGAKTQRAYLDWQRKKGLRLTGQLNLGS